MNVQELKTVFFGTSEFAGVVLGKLIENNLNIIGVITQPDKPVGRKKVMTPPLAKVLAEKNGLTVFQPANLKSFDKNILAQADIFVVADYGEIISKKILEIPKFGAVNIHPSLLPKYRGPAPVQAVLLHGDRETGVTIIKMDEKMDHGQIVASRKCEIKEDERYLELLTKLAKAGGGLLVEILEDYINGKIELKEQGDAKASYTKMIDKKDGLVDFNKNAQEIYNQWRAFSRWPGIYMEDVNLGRLKLIEVKLFTGEAKNNTGAGELFQENKNLLVRCQEDSLLEILRIQPEGKKEMDAAGFINGYLR